MKPLFLGANLLNQMHLDGGISLTIHHHLGSNSLLVVGSLGVMCCRDVSQGAAYASVL